MGTSTASLGRRLSLHVSAIYTTNPINLFIILQFINTNFVIFSIKSDIAAECGCKALQKVQDFDAVLTAKLTIQTARGPN